MKVNFFNETNENLKEYQKIIKKALKKEKNKRSIEIVFVTEDRIKELNLNFRNIDKVTDVLSFPNDDFEGQSLGDVFICIKRAMEQAEEYGHSTLREFAFLAVHGYLHLLGYDHIDKEEEKIMFSMQDEILKKAKIERK